jgi:AraC-like DNA-binding protein
MARIRTALEQTKAPIKDIVTANGYYDVANFTRKFKKINGVTPTQYRQLHQRAGSKDDDAIL